MKITTNLISPPGKFAPYIAIGLWLLSAALLMLAVFLWLRVGQLHQEVPALKTRLEQFNSRLRGVDAVMLPPHEQLMAVKESIASINQLSGSHNGSLLSTLAKLEAQLPHDVSLVELTYRRRAGEIQITAEAVRSEVVGKLLQDMERSGYFSEVLLVRQASNSQASNAGKNSGRVQFEIQLKERP